MTSKNNNATTSNNGTNATRTVLPDQPMSWNLDTWALSITTATAINTSPCDKCGVRPGSIEILSGQVKSGQRWSGQNRPTDVARDLILLTQLLLIRQACFRSPAPWSAFQDVTVV